MSNKEKTTQNEGLQNVESALNRTENWFEKHQKLIIIIFAAIVVIALGIIAYIKFVQQPKNREAMTELYMAEFAFAEDNFELALNGIEGEYSGFAAIVEDYGRTPSGNAARYYAGVCCMRLGQYEDAITYLEGFDSDDPMVGPMAVALIGDAHMELGDNEKAAKHYTQAAEKANNDYLSPLFLIKAGNTYELMGEYQKALDTYKRVQDDYYTVLERNDKTNIEKYIKRAEMHLGK
ncbi:MAG: tetratricopeptide repeat protein [Bacteroidales bacterium]|nr:tetratricopeptide repeat protein [Bacteroidales bacterium]